MVLGWRYLWSGILVACTLLGMFNMSGCASARTDQATASPTGPSGGPRKTNGVSAEHLRAGEQLLEQGALDQALLEFERAIESNPTLTVAYLRAGDIYRERGDYSGAERRYGEAARIEPRNFDAQYLHGLSLQLLQRMDEAVRAYLRALAIRPDDFYANLNLGTTFLQLDEPEQGLPYAVRATQLRPADGPARVNLGATYAALGRHAEAIVQFDAASEVMTLGPELLINVAESQGQLGHFEDMEGTLRHVVRIQPSAAAWERLGSAQFRSRRYQDALESFRTSIQLDPSHYPAHNGIAVCLLNRYLWSGRNDIGALDGAVSSMRTSLRLRRDQPRILELLTRYGGQTG